MHIGKEVFYDWLLLKPQQPINDILRMNGMELNYMTEDEGKVKLHYETLLQNIFKRNMVKVFKGNIPYVQELQRLLDHHTASDKKNTEYYQEELHNVTGLYVSSTTNMILVQCGHCGKHTTPEPYNCQICLNVSYCTHGCQTNHKYTHYQHECRERMYPKSVIGVQFEIHLGSDLGQDIEIHYQHQSRMSFKIKAREFISRLAMILETSRYLKKYLYQIEAAEDCVKILKQKAEMKQEGDEVSLKTFDEVCLIYLLDPALYYLRLVMIRQGCVLKDIVKEIYNSHVHIVLVFACPL